MTKTERTETQLRHQMATMAAQICTLQTHNDRLNAELPLMRKENRRLMDFIQDTAAFIRIANSGKGTWNSNMMLSTLIHDISGIANDEKCFSPRVTGYAQRERDDQ